MPLKLLAFDLGGLLINTGEIPSRKVWEAYDLSEEEAMLIWKKHDEDFFSGRISEDEWWGYFNEMAPNKVPLENIKKIFREAYGQYKENLEFVGRITRNCEEHVTAYWSNNSLEWFNFQKKKFQIDKFVDVPLSSHEIGMTKHHPEFFNKAFEETCRRYKHDFSKDDIIFFDDNKTYCQNCQAYGIRAVYIPTPEVFQERVRKATGINI